jgi:hypothetical protein
MQFGAGYREAAFLLVHVTAESFCWTSALYVPGGAIDVSVVTLSGVGRDCSGIGVQEELGNKPV